jgi:hypothetical protein
MSDSVLLEYELQDDSALTSSNIDYNNTIESKFFFTIEIKQGSMVFSETIDLRTSNITYVTQTLAKKYNMDPKGIRDLIEMKLNKQENEKKPNKAETSILKKKQNNNNLNKNVTNNKNKIFTPKNSERITENIEKILGNTNVRFDTTAEIYTTNSNSISPKKKAFSGKQVYVAKTEIDLNSSSPQKTHKSTLSQNWTKNSHKFSDLPAKDNSFMTTTKKSSSSK